MLEQIPLQPGDKPIAKQISTLQPMGDPVVEHGHALKELQPVESPCCQFFLRDFSTWEKPTLEHEWERRLRSCYRLTTTTPHHLGHGGGRGGENEGVKQPWKKGVRSRCFSCCLCVSPFSSIVNEIHSILFSPESIWAVTIIAE